MIVYGFLKKKDTAEKMGRLTVVTVLSYHSLTHPLSSTQRCGWLAAIA